MSHSADVPPTRTSRVRARERAAARHAVSAAVTSLAHDINNPLNSISTNAELALLLTQQSPEQIPRILRRIVEDCRRCADVVQNVVNRIQADQTDEAVDLPAVLALAKAEVTDALALPADAIDLQLPASMLGALSGCAEALVFACRELLINAFAAGARRVRIGAEQADGFLRIAFSDDGPGVPAEIAEGIFGSFHSARSGQRGVGLGLGMARRIVADHGGKIRHLPGSAQQGATFEMVLPAGDRPPV